MRRYAELAVATNFSFLRGASHPQEMVATADELGCFAVGIADRNSFAGVVRAYDEAKNRKIKLLVGARLVTIDGFEVLAYPTDRPAYGRLCRLITAGNLKAKKGEQLPDWEHSDRMAWPPPRPSLAAQFAMSMVPQHDPRYSADWAAAQEADNVRRQQNEARWREEEAARQVASRQAYEASLRR